VSPAAEACHDSYAMSCSRWAITITLRHIKVHLTSANEIRTIRHLCCRRFTPTLIDVYNRLKKKDKNFEIIYISLDHTPVQFQARFADVSIGCALELQSMHNLSLHLCVACALGALQESQLVSIASLLYWRRLRSL
jgi:Thioredoxin-like